MIHGSLGLLIALALRRGVLGLGWNVERDCCLLGSCKRIESTIAERAPDRLCRLSRLGRSSRSIDSFGARRVEVDRSMNRSISRPIDRPTYRSSGRPIDVHAPHAPRRSSRAHARSDDSLAPYRSLTPPSLSIGAWSLPPLLGAIASGTTIARCKPVRRPPVRPARAQSARDFGHRSIGLFRPAVKRSRTLCSPAVFRPGGTLASCDRGPTVSRTRWSTEFVRAHDRPCPGADMSAQPGARGTALRCGLRTQTVAVPRLASVDPSIASAVAVAAIHCQITRSTGRSIDRRPPAQVQPKSIDRSIDRSVDRPPVCVDLDRSTDRSIELRRDERARHCWSSHDWRMNATPRRYTTQRKAHAAFIY
jgi:hypothetical protein